MPGTRCTVGVCSNSLVKAKKSGLPIRFYGFPKDEELRKEWVIKCQRAGQWNPNSCRVCSYHFRDDDFERDLKNELLGLPIKKILKKNAVPSLLLSPQEKLTSSGKRREKRVKNKNEDSNDRITESKSVNEVVVKNEIHDLDLSSTCNGRWDKNDEYENMKMELDILQSSYEALYKKYLSANERNVNLQQQMERYKELYEDEVKKNSKLKKQMLKIEKKETAELPALSANQVGAFIRRKKIQLLKQKIR